VIAQFENELAIEDSQTSYMFGGISGWSGFCLGMLMFSGVESTPVLFVTVGKFSSDTIQPLSSARDDQSPLW